MVVLVLGSAPSLPCLAPISRAQISGAGDFIHAAVPLVLRCGHEDLWLALLQRLVEGLSLSGPRRPLARAIASLAPPLAPRLKTSATAAARIEGLVRTAHSFTLDAHHPTFLDTTKAAACLALALPVPQRAAEVLLALARDLLFSSRRHPPSGSQHACRSLCCALTSAASGALRTIARAAQSEAVATALLKQGVWATAEEALGTLRGVLQDPDVEASRTALYAAMGAVLSAAASAPAPGIACTDVTLRTVVAELEGDHGGHGRWRCSIEGCRVMRAVAPRMVVMFNVVATAPGPLPPPSPPRRRGR